MAEPLFSPESLEAAGFKEYRSGIHDRHDRSWARMVRSGGKRLFQVTVRFWMHSRYSTPDRAIPDGWDAECQFRDSNGVTFNMLCLLDQNWGPEELVSWFTEVFRDLRGTPYEDR